MIKTDYILKELIVGAAVTDDKSYMDTAYYLASSALDTQSVHAQYEYQDGYVFYIAVPAASLDNVQAATSLCSALKMSKNHKGDGLYIYESRDFCVGLIRLGNKFQKLTGSKEDVLSSVAQDVLTFNVTNDESDVLLPFKNAQAIQVANMFESFNSKLAKGIAALSISLTVMIGVNFFMKNGDLSYKDDVSKNIAQIVSKFNEKTDIYAQLQTIRILSADVSKAGGWIKSYRQIDNNVTFQIVMPEWVTKEYIEPLGAVSATRNKEDGTIIFTRGDVVKK